jgi:hypothetical protein
VTPWAAWREVCEALEGALRLHRQHVGAEWPETRTEATVVALRRQRRYRRERGRGRWRRVMQWDNARRRLVMRFGEVTWKR